MLRNIALDMYNDWGYQSENAVFSMLEKNKEASLLDLGCGDGKFTKKVAKIINTKKISAIESLKVKIAKFDIKNSNLNHKFPFPSNSFDVVLSNYSIEHLYNTPLFISETYRVLKKSGYTVVATENLSSWANIISLILGFQAFSAFISIKGKVVGNPFAINSEGSATDKLVPEFEHNKVLAYRGLLDSYKAFGFIIERTIGVGYLPFKSVLSKIFSAFDPRHSHLLIIKARKI